MCRKRRLCLSCLRKFDSTGPGNRICGRCKFYQERGKDLYERTIIRVLWAKENYSE